MFEGEHKVTIGSREFVMTIERRDDDGAYLRFSVEEEGKVLSAGGIPSRFLAEADIATSTDPPWQEIVCRGFLTAVGIWGADLDG